MRLTALLALAAALVAPVSPLPGPVGSGPAPALAADALPDTSKMSALELMAWRARRAKATQDAPAEAPPAPLPAGVTCLTKTPGQDKDPCWSPDGASLYFAYEEGGRSVIRRLDLASGGSVAVTDTLWKAMTPDLSPDGRHLVFCRQTVDFGWKLWIQRLEDGESAKLTPVGDESREQYPRWSATGMKIYFERMIPATMDSPGLSITREGENEEVLLTGRGLHTRPAVSRSGKKVAWVNRLGKETSIKIMDTKISALVETYDLPGRYLASLDWLPAPEDQRLVVCWLDEAKPLEGYSLGIYDLASKTLTPLLDLGKSELDPRVSPDGKRLVFSANQDGNYELYLYELP